MIQLQEFNTRYPNPYDYGNWRAATGVAFSAELGRINRQCHNDRRPYGTRLVYCSPEDLA